MEWIIKPRTTPGEGSGCTVKVGCGNKICYGYIPGCIVRISN